MNKKIVSLMMASAMLVPGAVLLGGCDHEHTYGEWETLTAATCQAAEVEVRKCECGVEETREGDPATGHTYYANYFFDAEGHWRSANCGHNVKTDEGNHEDLNADGVCDVCTQGAVVSVGGKYYANVQDAVNSITDNTVETVIEFVASKVGGGVIVNGQNVVFEMNGYSYTVDQPPVGSPGTQTLGFQLLKGSKVTFRNGTVRTTGTSVKMLIQNYCDLTLDNVLVDATNPNFVCQYALSNNFGNVVIKNNTIIRADEDQVAFDVWFGLLPTCDYDEGVSVTFDETFTGGVIGKIEYGATAAGAERVADWQDRTVLVIKGGEFTSETGFTILRGTAEDANIQITGGSFDFDGIVNYVDEDAYQIVEDEGMYFVVPHEA